VALVVDLTYLHVGLRPPHHCGGLAVALVVGLPAALQLHGGVVTRVDGERQVPAYGPRRRRSDLGGDLEQLVAVAVGRFSR